ncbi:MAG: DUF4389 domain-containing protein [Methylomonas sp.]|uniref:DUF4389 domain-containing protein n=1 Tax=Methylomonas sp. TaxID=418 RepID=UPI0025E9A617|nr:DUF4389 domain-containing protein [Methylomonas sp.]MCK9609071.1 DUF4389 domain-containing protein [Methylomonas sp.]
MQEQINENLKRISTWKRIIFMLIYAVIDSMVKLLLWLVVLLQVGSVLITGATNPNILGFGRSLSTYHYHILLFLTFNTEQLPFPFSDWNLTAELESSNRL